MSDNGERGKPRKKSEENEDAGSQNPARRKHLFKRVLFGIGFVMLSVLALSAFLWTQGNDTDGPAWAVWAGKPRVFTICGENRRDCVVDGDTLWMDGDKIRIADIDTPEISDPKCDSEYRLGIAARDRLLELLNQGAFTLKASPGRDEDRYGRKLRFIMRGDVSLGDQLVDEGLAREWLGRREPWC